MASQCTARVHAWSGRSGRAACVPRRRRRHRRRDELCTPGLCPRRQRHGGRRPGVGCGGRGGAGGRQQRRPPAAPAPGAPGVTPALHRAGARPPRALRARRRGRRPGGRRRGGRPRGRRPAAGRRAGAARRRPGRRRAGQQAAARRRGGEGRERRVRRGGRRGRGRGHGPGLRQPAGGAPRAGAGRRGAGLLRRAAAGLGRHADRAHPAHRLRPPDLGGADGARLRADAAQRAQEAGRQPWRRP